MLRPPFGCLFDPPSLSFVSVMAPVFLSAFGQTPIPLKWARETI